MNPKSLDELLREEGVQNYNVWWYGKSIKPDYFSNEGYTKEYLDVRRGADVEHGRIYIALYGIDPYTSRYMFAVQLTEKDPNERYSYKWELVPIELDRYRKKLVFRNKNRFSFYHNSGENFYVDSLQTENGTIPFDQFTDDDIRKLAIDDTEEKNEQMKAIEYPKNMILYGPPGTGKTYKSVIYAVAICEDKSIDELTKEPYEEVLLRYRKLKDNSRIEFTTFHQSYGYEEFIEGIKPQLNSDSHTLEYTIEDGVFKEFCDRAREIVIQYTTEPLMKKQPRIWGMILGGSGITELKQECFAKNEIRLGWKEINDEDINDLPTGDENSSWIGKRMVFDFKNSMDVGDLVVVEKTIKSIDAIGVVTGEYEYDKTHKYPRKRSVKWLVKGIDEEVVSYLQIAPQTGRFCGAKRTRSAASGHFNLMI